MNAAERYPSPAEWRVDARGQLRPFLSGSSSAPVAWAPQAGSQVAFLQDETREVLYCGPKGFGKTESLLVDFARDTGRGWGSHWHGILFRRTFGELKDVEEKALRLFPQIFPEAVFTEGKHLWRWPGGEYLQFSYMEKTADYDKHHGHEIPWIGWEELSAWAIDTMYRNMFGCLRSSHAEVAKAMRVRSTTNPYGLGHSWIKLRFKLPIVGDDIVGPVIRDPKSPIPRRAIKGRLDENRVMLHADPTYMDTLMTAADSEAKRAAWIDGSWDILAGGYFADVWDQESHVVPSIPWELIPAGWRIDRAYDDGSAKPFSVGWYAQSNGEPIVVRGRRIGEVPGDLVRVAEWYGWDGRTPNVGARLTSREIALGIKDREEEWGIRRRVQIGPADSNIFAGDASNAATSVAGEMGKVGVRWTEADKARVPGWKAVTSRLKAAKPDKEGRRESSGLYVTEDCEHFLRTIPGLPASKTNPDDVNTDAEDHVADEVRYRCHTAPRQKSAGGTARIIGEFGGR